MQIIFHPQAYDSVPRKLLWSKLLKFGFSRNFVDILRALYEGDSLEVTVGDKNTCRIFPRRGLRQVIYHVHNLMLHLNVALSLGV